jgi:multicomponent K+:H+ antiporter subunit A
MLLAVVLALPFAGALAAALVPSGARSHAALIAGGTAVLGLVLLGLQWSPVAHGAVLTNRIEWVDALGFASP